MFRIATVACMAVALVSTWDTSAHAAVAPADVGIQLAFAACKAGGPTATDTAVANQVRPFMNGLRLGGAVDAYNISCASIITETTRSRGLAKRAAVIAVTTAITESTLHNYTEAADHDSLGLFQQRPSQGWGTPAQLTDPVYATNAFLNAMLRKYPNNSWMSGDIGAICQAVQVSAFPDAYGREVHDAQLIVDALWDVEATATSNGRMGDLNGNGLPDRVAFSSDRDSIYISGQYLSSGWKTVDHKFTVDWDGDGKADILGRNGDDLFAWRSTSTATTWSLAPFVNLGAGNASVSQFLIGDFDGNGRPDLAAFTSDRNSLYMSRNTSTPGSLSKGGGQFLSSGWRTVDQKMVADWDGDGKDDILGRNGDDLFVWRSTSTSSAWSFAPFVNFGGGNASVSQYLIGDFDGNGRPDLAAFTSDRDTVYFSRNTSTPGSPSKGGGQFLSSGWKTVNHKMIADWDGDGKDDIIGRNGDDLFLWRSTSTGSGWSLSPYINLGGGNATVSQFLTDVPVR